MMTWLRARESKSWQCYIGQLSRPLLLLLLLAESASGSQDTNLLTETDQLNTTLNWRHAWPSVLGALNNNHSPEKAFTDDEYVARDISSFAGFEQHPCRRVCQLGDTQTCYYQLVVHNYQRLGPECRRCQYDERSCAAENCIYGDGVATPVMAVNRMVPAPAIELCENDTVTVDVLNYLTEATTIHWHGVHMSMSPEMDGAPFVTQYPVQPGEVFRYSFRADRSGTIWYHSHVGWQRALGVAGHMLIRQPRQANRHARLYDYDLVEHALIVQDIFYGYDFNTVSNILINGKGRNHMTSWPDNDSRNRYERLRVSPGYRYRVRVISNGVFNCPVEFSIENHKLLVISTDGNDIEPVQADAFFLTSAERFDFVLEAKQYAANYWIRVRGYEGCMQTGIYQGAVLSYRGAGRSELPRSESILVDDAVNQSGRVRNAQYANKVLLNNPYFSNASSDRLTDNAKDTNLATAALRSLYPLPWSRYTKFLTYYSTFGMRSEANGERLFQIDDITYAPPGVSLLQARHLYQDDAYFCNRSSLAASGQRCQQDNCECLNVVRLPAYKPIELVVANLMEATHPFHIHGYTFRLVGQAVVGNVDDLRRLSELDRRGQLQRLPNDYPAVAKDTVQVPGLGYIIVRFISDNPGFWLYHCHIERHAVQGMVAVLKIGENYQMKRIPAKIRC